MTMPIDFVLVRHGLSEGNVANKLSRKGDDQHFTDAFMKRHSSTWRLTDLGISQAEAAGEWLRTHNLAKFDRYYVSEYLRAMETAHHLNLPNAEWYTEFYLRERDWGSLDTLPDSERRAKFEEALRKRKSEPFFWTPPNGVSLADVCLRVDRVLNTLHRECSDKKVVIVCHGEIMWCFRIRLERMTQEAYKIVNGPGHDKIHNINNCQVLHYTRRDPKTGLIQPHLGWLKSVCPWDETKSLGEWEPLVRNRLSNYDLAKYVGEFERQVA